MVVKSHGLTTSPSKAIAGGQKTMNTKNIKSLSTETILTPKLLKAKGTNNMGYTHYWTFDPTKIKDKKVLQDKFSSASYQIQEFSSYINRNKLFTVCGGIGEGKPLFNDSEVWFNGCAQEGLDHETFSIKLKTPERAFCKTARKPYDLLACFSLLTFAQVFPKEVFSFSSDGAPSEEEWQKAIEYYEHFTGKIANYK